MTDTFSSNGTDPGAYAIASDIDGGEQGEGGGFLSDLAKAMQATAAAEQARDAEVTEQRRKAHLDSIRAREAIEAEDLRELAKEDVKGIDAWSDGEIKRIKLERERRIASRREQLQIRLEEHRGVVAREVDAVEAAVATYRTEIAGYFSRLGSGTDPVEIARQAGTRPAFPALEDIGPDGARSAAVAAAIDEDSAPAAVTEDVPGYNVTMYSSDTVAAERDRRGGRPGGDPAGRTGPGRRGRGRAGRGRVRPGARGGRGRAEPVVAEAEPEPEPVVAEAEPEPEPVIAETEEQPVTAEADQPAEGDGADAPLVGVMDPEASSQPTETPGRHPRAMSRTPRSTRQRRHRPGTRRRSRRSRTTGRPSARTQVRASTSTRVRKSPSRWGRRASSCPAARAPAHGSAGRTARPTDPTWASNRLTDSGGRRGRPPRRYGSRVDSILALIPGYQEGPRIAAVVAAAALHLPVVVVDDGSTDDTAGPGGGRRRDRPRPAPERGQGRGPARAASGTRSAHDAAAVVTLDADGQHDPAEIPTFLAAFAADRPELVLGRRDFGSMPPVRRLSNTLGGLVFSAAVGRRIADNQSGYRLIGRRLMTAAPRQRPSPASSSRSR